MIFNNSKNCTWFLVDIAIFIMNECLEITGVFKIAPGLIVVLHSDTTRVCITEPQAFFKGNVSKFAFIIFIAVFVVVKDIISCFRKIIL